MPMTKGKWGELELPARAEIRDEILHVGRRVVFEQLEVRGLTRRRAHAFARHRRAWSEEARAKRRSVVLAADARQVTSHRMT